SRTCTYKHSLYYYSHGVTHRSSDIHHFHLFLGGVGFMVFYGFYDDDDSHDRHSLQHMYRNTLHSLFLGKEPPAMGACTLHSFFIPANLGFEQEMEGDGGL